MDTKLKKFNLSALFKFIAVILCLATVGVSVCYAATEFIFIKKDDLQSAHFYDAVYNTNNKNIAMTQAFKRESNLYMGKIAELVAYYGNGSKDAYETLVESCEKKNSETVKRAKENLVSSLTQRDGFQNYLAALSEGDIENCGYVEFTQDVADNSKLYADDITNEAIDYAYLAGESFYVDDIPYEYNITKEVEKLLKKNKADGIVFIPSDADVYEGEFDDEGSFITSYPAGYYLFRINEKNFVSHLVKSDDIMQSTYSSYEDFRKSFDSLKAYINENYPSGRYYIKDVKGNTYTNIKTLDKDSSEKDIEKQFSSLGFYCSGSDGYHMVLPDGTQYDSSFVGALESAIFDEGSVNYYKDYPVMETTTLPTVTTTLPREQVTIPPVPTTSKDGYEVTVFTDVIEDTTDFTQVAVTAPVAAQNNYNGKSPFIIATEKATDMTVYFGVDFEDKAYTDMDCRFGKVQRDIYSAFSITKALIIVGSTMGLVFLACFIFLVMKSGRRFGDRENVYMLPCDGMFTDFRILLDCGIIFLLGLCGLWVIEEFYIETAEVIANEMIILLTGALGSAIILFVLDIILFITRHIRNKTFFKRIFLVWLIEKSSNKVSDALKIKSIALKVLVTLLIPINLAAIIIPWGLGWDAEEILFLSCPFAAVYDLITAFIFAKEKGWTEPVKEKLQYVKGFEKQTVIKGAVVLGVNFILGFLAVLELVNSETLWFSFILVGFDIFVCIQLVRFIAGIKKIFSAVSEIKEGNYEVQINLYAIPSSLREPAKKLMGLRDGLKSAVADAVKQEQTKTELITNVSHDLKTPLTSVINYVDLLKKCDITDETAKEYLNILGEKSDRLKKLIEDLVEASKASTGNIKLNLVQVSLNEILNQITGEFADEFEKHGLNLISDIPEESITVLTDSKSLYRVLENLMGNVAKYAMENTRVYLSLESTNGKNIISLKNISGSPLNVSAGELMERFVRADESRSSSGNGLGLSIAQSLCTVLGGKLEIEINADLFVAKVTL